MDTVVDSSSLISLSESCLIKVFEKISQSAKTNFFIAQSVLRESVENPLKIKRFEFNAVRIGKAIQENWVKQINSSPVTERLTIELENLANNCFFLKNRPLTLIHSGEAESLALLNQLNAKTLIIDERTTRLLIEDPERLRNFVQFKFNTKISINANNLEEFRKKFSNITIIRSTELIAYAFEKNLLSDEIPSMTKSLEAALYAVKYAGCSVSSDEIDSFVKNFGNSSVSSFPTVAPDGRR